ncbi:MAG: GIY-YIG nuclease family protein [Chloroflexota bacterium]
MMGSYVLIIKLPETKQINIGSLKSVRFHRGYYAYVGSAMGGFRARLSHHFKENKKIHWHIDYLLQKASITSIILCEAERRIECTIAQALKRQLDFVSRFGSSDCRCGSHLFFHRNEKKMKSIIITTLKELGMQSHTNNMPNSLEASNVYFVEIKGL